MAMSTQDVIDSLLRMDDVQRADRAEIGYDAIRDLFSLIARNWEQGQLLQLHEGNRASVIRRLKRNQNLSQSSGDLVGILRELGVEENGLADPTALTDISTHLTHLLKGYPSAFSGQQRVLVEDGRAHDMVC